MVKNGKDKSSIHDSRFTYAPEGISKFRNRGEAALCHHTIRFMLAGQAWENFFKLNKIEPYTIFYEDFIPPATWEITIQSVLDFLEVEYQLPLNPNTPCLQQSHDDKLPEIYKRVIGYVGCSTIYEYLTC